MAKILILSSNLKGMTYSSLELASRLNEIGHQIFYTNKSKIEDKDLISPAIKQVNFPAPKIKFKLSFIEKLALAISSLRSSTTSGLDSKFARFLQLDRIRDKLLEVDPDLVIVDMELHEEILVLDYLEINFVLLSQWFSIWENEKIPPPNSLHIPDGNPNLINSLWRDEIAKRLKNERNSSIKNLGITRKNLLFKLAAGLKFPIEEWISGLWPGPFVYKSFPVWSMTSPALEFDGTNRINYKAIGPMVNLNRENISKDQKKKVESVTDYACKEGYKIICMTSTTMVKSDSGILDNIISIVERNESWVLAARVEKKVATSCKRVFLFDFLPQIEILKNSDCCIHHGGIHTINECIAFDVPMMVFPGNQHDQNSCAARNFRIGNRK
jgi:hypothetical protein